MSYKVWGVAIVYVVMSVVSFGLGMNDAEESKADNIEKCEAMILGSSERDVCRSRAEIDYPVFKAAIAAVASPLYLSYYLIREIRRNEKGHSK